MRWPVLILGYLVVASFFPQCVHAWNNAGHKTVALGALRILNDKTKKKVFDVLKEHPHFTCFLSANKPDDVSMTEWIVVNAATWPDFVRPPYTHNPCVNIPGKHPKQYHKPLAHFKDQDFIPPGQTDVHKKKDTNGVNAVSELAKVVKDLGDSNLSGEERAIQLCWLLHLVGDIHQPLHAATLVSDQFPEGDRGGNSFFVPNRRHAPNLHHYWDSLLGEDSGFASVDLVVARAQRTTRFERKNFEEELKKTDFSDWANESFAMAIKFAYRSGELKGLDLTHHNPGAHVAAMSETYESDALEIAQKRGALAVYRLADVLARLFP